MMHWRVHAGLLPGREGELAALLESAGDSLQLVSGHWKQLPLPVPRKSGEIAGLALTTLQDAVRLPEQGWVNPRMLYFSEQRFNVSYWLPRLSPSIPVLNRGCLFVPAGLIPHITCPVPRNGDTPVFIRPDSGLKPFTGISVEGNTWLEVAHGFSNEVKGLAPEKLVCIAPGRCLASVEWRFWIVNREVVASSPYGWSEEEPSWQEPPTEALHLAEMMAGNAWQPDIAYVADVVQLQGESEDFYLNELNAASTSGLYNVQLGPLLSALRHSVRAELEGDLALED